MSRTRCARNSTAAQLVTLEPTAHGEGDFAVLTGDDPAAAWRWLRERACGDADVDRDVAATAAAAASAAATAAAAAAAAPSLTRPRLPVSFAAAAAHSLTHVISSDHAQPCAYYNTSFRGRLRRRPELPSDALAEIVLRRFRDDFAFGFWDPAARGSGGGGEGGSLCGA
jgi:hypothetical protein